jgi:hypothetical protein
MRTSSTDRIDQLVLVWLMVPRTKSSASGFYDQLKPVADGKDDRKRLADESIARLQERGLIEPGSKLHLTEAGRRSAAEILGFPRVPEGPKALEWAKKVLLLRGMDVAPTNAAIETAGTANVLAARILSHHHKLDRKIAQVASDPKKHKQVASKVVAALARRALGLEETLASLKLNDAFAAVFLMGHSPTEREEDHANGHSEPASGTVSRRLEDCDINEFAHQVTEAARASRDGRWHGAVFISHVWNTLRARGDVGITFDQFKRRLIEAHQDKLIELSRADLVDAMPAADVSASETVHSGARFHFVRLQLAS